MTAIEPTLPLCDCTNIWCAIPVYNNAGTIRDVAERCRRQLAHVLVVDDGSSDADLRELLRDLDVTVIRHPQNAGKGTALMTALRCAGTHGAEYLISIDGDGQHFPEDIPRFLAKLAPDMIVIGHRDQVIGAMPQRSRFGREFSDFWFAVETGQRVRDTQSGFRAYPVWAVLGMKFCSRHYNFEMEVIARGIWAGLRVTDVPIRVWYPEQAQRVSSFRPFVDNLRISLLHARLVARQLLPVPHWRVGRSVPMGGRERVRKFILGNTAPLGLAAAAGIGMLMGVLPWRGFHAMVLLYVMVRLHLNKPMAVGFWGIGILVPVSMAILAPVLAVISWAGVYWTARR